MTRSRQPRAYVAFSLAFAAVFTVGTALGTAPGTASSAVFRQAQDAHVYYAVER